MNTPPSHPHLSRRSFLKLLAAGSATAAGGYVLYEIYETAPWLNYDQQVASLQRTIVRETLPQLVIRMGYASAMPRSPRRPVAQALAEAGAPA